MDKIYILDAVNYLFRSFYAIKGMKNKEGVPTNALYGFVRSIQKIFKDFSPKYFVAVFDGPDNKKNRTAIYANYKAHRTSMPPELYEQLNLAHKYCELAGIPMLCIPGVEADDTMGTIAKFAEDANSKSYLISSDKDLSQLINDHISILQVHKDNLIIDAPKVKEIYGIEAKQFVDYLAIVGDASDNIPGIAGFGPKAATDLLNEFGSLENIYKHIDQIKNEKRKEKLISEKDNAFLSYQLATIQTTVEIPRESDFYRLKPPYLEELRSFFQEMNFASLLKELEVIPQSTPNEEKVAYHCIQTEKDLDKLITVLSITKEICIDTETTSIEPMLAKLVGIGLGVKPNEAYYIPFNGSLPPDLILRKLTPILTSKNHSFIGHNIKYDLHVLLNAGISPVNVSFDTMIASYLLHPNLNRHGLDQLSADLFGKTKLSYKELTTVDKKQVPLEEIEIEKVAHYCCEDVDYTLRLKERFEDELKQKELYNLFYKIELPLLYVLLGMERHGMFVDSQYLKMLSKEFGEKITELEQAIFDICGETFNIKSPKQLSEVLFEKMKIPYPRKKKAGFSTSADILEELSVDNPFIAKILEYRTFEKLRSTYVDSLPEQINPNTHRIHPTFNQSVTATGRLSCQNPNLQNIPIRSADGKKIRTAFRPQKENWSFLAADYSQIELRILAHLSKDPGLVNAFLLNQDIHTYTASLIFDIPVKEVTSVMRQNAKAVNFGIIYGQQAFGLSKETNMSFKEAARFIETYFKRYPKVKAFIDSTIEKARETGYTETLFGRKRPLEDINSSNKMLQSQAERYAVNAPIQGTQADIIKLAMIKIAEKIKESSLQSYMILQIHDELIFECPDEELPIIKKIVSSTMQGVYHMEVPLRVDIAIGKNWGDC